MIIALGSAAALLLAYLAWRWYDWAVAMIVLLIPAYLLRFHIFGIPTNVWEVGVVVVFLVGVARPTIRYSWQQSLRAIPRTFVVLTGLLLVSAIVSTVISAQLEVSLGILKGWIAVPILASLLVYSRAKSARQTYNLLLDTLVAAGSVTALLSLTQLQFGERLAGIYDVPNSLALWLAPIITLAVMRLVVDRRRGYILSIFVMATALVLTQSLAGIMVVVLALSLAGMLWSPRPLFAAGILILTVVVGVGVLQNSSSSQATLAVRKQLWSVGADLVREQPILGIGLGQFEPHYQRVLHERFASYKTIHSPPRGLPRGIFEANGTRVVLLAERPPPQHFRKPLIPAASRGVFPAPNNSGKSDQSPLSEFVFRDPHNWPLAWWLNLGLAGLISFIGLHVIVFRHSRDRSVTVALVCLLLFGLVDTIYWKNDLAIVHWILLLLALP